MHGLIWESHSAKFKAISQNHIGIKLALWQVKMFNVTLIKSIVLLNKEHLVTTLPSFASELAT